MYNPNVLTNTERVMLRAMQEETQEVQASSSHRLDPRYTNAFTMNEIQYLSEMPPTDRFESSHRPRPGMGRNILHAAAIFNTNFSPTPTYYQLPPRLRRYQGDTAPRGNGLRDEGTHQRKDSGYESGMCMLMGDDDEDDDGIDAWCDAVLAQGQLAEPNQHILRPDAPSFRPGVPVDSKNHDDDATRVFGEASQDQDDDSHPVACLSPGQNPEIYGSSNEESQNEQDYNRQGRFALVLDYQGIDWLLKCGVRGTRSEGAESEDDEETYDEHFEEGSRARWSV